MRKATKNRILSMLLALTMAFSAGAWVISGSEHAEKIDNSEHALSYAWQQSFQATQYNSQHRGLIGFKGEYALDNDDTLVSVIVLFENNPAAIQLIEAQASGRSLLSESMAENIVEADHVMFRQELDILFGSSGRDADRPFKITREYRKALNGVSMTLPSNMVSALGDFESVRAIYPNIRLQASPPIESSSPECTNPLGMAPGRATMRADDMHALGYTGEGVVVAILDTGIYANHPAFEGAFMTLEEMQQRNPNITYEDTINGYFIGRCLFSIYHPQYPSNDPWDFNGHGTHVAGTAVGRNTGRILGVAPGASVFAYRLIDLHWESSLATVLAGVNMLAYDKPDVVNMSIGFGPQYPHWGGAPMHITSLAVNNIMLAHPYMHFIIAAGNGGSSGYFTLRSPGDASLPITVGSANVTMVDVEGLSSFSSIGPVYYSFEIKPDIIADGGGVYSADIIPPYSECPKEWYSWRSGTSMATPHIAGAVALLIEYSERNHGNAWNAEEIKVRLMNTATPITVAYGDAISQLSSSAFATGAGYVDVYAAAHADTFVYVINDRVLYGNETELPFYQQSFTTGKTGSFSFGEVGNEDTPLSLLAYPNPNARTLTVGITNSTGNIRTYTIQYSFNGNSGYVANMTLDQRSVIVGPWETANFTVTISVAGHIPGMGCSCYGCSCYLWGITEALFEGYVYVLEDGALKARLPFGFVNVNCIYVPSPTRILRFNLGGTLGSPTVPAYILPVSVPVGAEILTFLRDYYDVFPQDGPTREGFTFLGWYYDADFTMLLGSYDLMVGGNYTLHARWEVARTSIFQVRSHTEFQYAINHLATNSITEQTTITMMNDFAATGETITIPAGVNVILTSSPGNVFTYTRSIMGRHFVVGGVLTLQNVVLCGDSAELDHGFDALDFVQGGVSVGGHLIMEEGSAIVNSVAFEGGAVSVSGSFLSDLSFTMRAGAIEGNTSFFGGGVRMQNGTFNMTGGTIRNNHSVRWDFFIPSVAEFSGTGGGIILGGFRGMGGGILNISGGIIEDNTAVVGGGIGSTTGSMVVTLTDGEIRSNTADYGGGFWMRGASINGVNINGGHIRDNHAIQDGGGIFTERASNYQNPMPPELYFDLNIREGARFSGNTAGNGSFNPPSNALAIMPRAASVSVFDHQLNNYDINFNLPSTSSKTLTLHLYDNTNSYITIPVELYSPLCPIALTPIIALMEDDNH
ncbi:MAG: S8 family serine peptidase, partial [Defluviitaleaceae bacterium]|nr:S8 family serine peptidase [Defluviitaleaceae bacterium]